MTDERSAGAAAVGPPDARREAEARLEEVAPGYLEKVREAAAALGVEGRRGAGVAAEVAAVREAAALDLEAPTASSSAPGTLLKLSVKRLTTWYLRYLAVQVAGFASAVAALSEALLVRLDELDAADANVARDLAALDARVAGVERWLAGAGGEAAVQEAGGGGRRAAGKDPDPTTEP
ncbi:MAG: hypothetical protein ACYDEN_06245 [Acidimicrobiales bacterium]